MWTYFTYTYGHLKGSLNLRTYMFFNLKNSQLLSFPVYTNSFVLYFWNSGRYTAEPPNSCPCLLIPFSHFILSLNDASVNFSVLFSVSLILCVHLEFIPLVEFFNIFVTTMLISKISDYFTFISIYTFKICIF